MARSCRPRWRGLIGWMAFASIALPVRAAEAPREPAVVVAGSDGFGLRSADGDFELRVRALLQIDGRFFLGDESPGVDAFVPRRVRPGFEGRVFGIYGYKVIAELGEGAVQPLLDAYVEVLPWPQAGLRAGRFVVPVELELQQPVAAIFLIERWLPTQLAPIRDLGVQLQGGLFDGALGYAAGLFDGAADGAGLFADFDDSKDLAGRLFAYPLRPLGLAPLEQLGLGFAATWGRPRGTERFTGLPSYATTGGLRFFGYRQGAVAAGERYRLVPQASWFYGPLGLLAEYVRSAQRVALGPSAAVITNSAWGVALTFVVGGEASFKRLVPRADLGDGGLGALQFSASLSRLTVGSAAFPRFADPAQSARAALNAGVGLTWAFNPAVALRTSFERTSFEGGAPGGDRSAELLLLSRLQLNL